MNRPWFRRQTWSWYVEVRGDQHNLGKHPFRDAPRKGRNGWNPPDPIAAAWKELDPEPKAADCPLREAIDRYLVSLDGCTKNTRRNAKQYLEGFLAHVGDLPVSRLRKHHLTSYFRTKAWSSSNQASFWGKFFACLNYSVDEGYVAALPFKPKRGEKPRFDRRISILTADQMDKIEAAVDENFRAFLQVLRDTGCRPIELATLTIDACDFGKGLAMVVNKTRKKTGIEYRPVYFTDRSMEVIRDQRRDSGCVFLNSRGRPWTVDALTHKMGVTRKRLKMGVECVLYSYRHGLASRAINSGNVNPALLARLLGHQDLKQLMKIYLHEDGDVMRQAARKAAGNETGQPVPNPQQCRTPTAAVVRDTDDLPPDLPADPPAW